MSDEKDQPGAEAIVEVRIDRKTRHDLMTHVNQILGYTDLLLETAEDEDEVTLVESTDDLSRIRKAARALQTELDQTLRGNGASPPAATTALPALDAAQDPETVVTEDPDPDGAGRVLVVDDNEVNRDMLSRRVRKLGHTVDTAKDGESALTMIGTRPYDLVLLDIMMPGIDGREVLRRLKQDKKTHHLPVIMISALDSLETVVECIELGAEDYLPKPFELTILKARVKAALSKKRMHDQEVRYMRMVEAEKCRADELLHVLLPKSVADELKSKQSFEPRRYPHVGVLFSDIVGFTPYSERTDAAVVLEQLNELVHEFERISAKYGLEKIKTNGDAYLAASGLFEPTDNPALDAVSAGLEMIDAAKNSSAGWQVRIGVHVGPVLAGILGQKKYLFDIWGDTVNTASRLESHGAPGIVNVSHDTWCAVQGVCSGESRGTFEVKGKGKMELFRVDGLKA